MLGDLNFAKILPKSNSVRTSRTGFIQEAMSQSAVSFLLFQGSLEVFTLLFESKSMGFTTGHA